MKKTLEFPADTASLSKIGDLIVEACRSVGFNEEEIGDIQLSVDEACTNTIIHGLGQDPDRNFRLDILSETGEIEIVIYERGSPFDTLEVKQPNSDAPLEERSVGGLGIYFIMNLMDEVEYRTDDEGTKIFRMLKRKRQDEVRTK
ncbi:MAG: ATP-binding protein [Candidatus Hatepunaea meridiana]|nr:ATP-binding protein [Candidatus Hatepunaea meridiana]